MASYINALKDRIVGSVEENVGYLVGNSDLEAHGRELKEHGAEETKTYYEQSGNINSPRNNDLPSSVEKHEDVETATAPSSLNPSLFSRNQPDPESSAHGALKEKMHSETIRQSSSDPMDTPTLGPINTSSDMLSGKDVQPLPERKEETSSTWVDKLGSIMGGNKDDSTTWKDVKEPNHELQDKESVMERLRNAHMEATAEPQDRESVMESLRNAHMEATSEPQDKGITETIKEKFDNWTNSSNSVFGGKERGFTDTVQEKVGDVKDQVKEKVGDMKDQVESYMGSTPADPLPMKQPPVANPADVPDTNFLKND